MLWDDKGEPQTNVMELLCISPSAPERPAVDDGSQLPVAGRVRKFREHALETGRKLRTITTAPKRLVWVKVDREEFETLSSRLATLNSYLIGLLDASHTRRLEREFETNYLELLRLRDDVKSLKDLSKALDWDRRDLHESSDQSSRSPFGESLSMATLAQRQSDEEKRWQLRRLGKLKIRRVEFDQLQEGDGVLHSNHAAEMKLDLSSFCVYQEIYGNFHKGRQSMASRGGHDVWIEWVEQSPDYQRHAKGFIVEDRMILLTRLLCEDKPLSFRAPKCLGYVQSAWQADGSEFGIVFEGPLGTDGKGMFMTLRQLLNDRPKPSLSSRISLSHALAGCINSFHTVNWLHKGIRSENILFLGALARDSLLSSPLVSGYGLSRPSEAIEMTQEPSFEPSSDIYRHPRAQFEEADGPYRKSYDMYSLGVVLLEVALWKPIEDIIGVENLRTIQRKDLRRVHDKLRGVSGRNHTDHATGASASLETSKTSKYIEWAASKCGESYGDIVERCLGASEVERPTYRGESQVSINLRLQMMFEQQVVEKLRTMKEVLGDLQCDVSDDTVQGIGIL